MTIRSLRCLAAAIALSCGVVLLHLIFLATTAFADDCKRDIRRAEDCLRTPGTAQTIAGGVATVVTVLVNGVAVSQTIFQRGGGDGEGGDDQKERQFWLDISTEDYRTTLTADEIDTLWVYGQVRCSDPEIQTDDATQNITFTTGGPYGDWLELDDPTMVQGQRAAMLAAGPPDDDAGLPDDGGSATVTVSAMIGGQMFSGDVQLKLEPDDWDLEFEFEELDDGEEG